MKPIIQNGFALEEKGDKLIFYRVDGEKLETKTKKYQAIISEMFETYILYKMEHATNNNKFDINLRLSEDKKVIEVDYKVIEPFQKIKEIIQKIFGNK